MTKKDLVKVVHEIHGGISSNEAREIVDTMLGAIKGRLLSGEKVMLTGFGVFKVTERKRRRGRNPQTGESIEIKGRRFLSFKPSKLLEF